MFVRQPVRAFFGLAVSVMLLSACQPPTKAGDKSAEATQVQEIPKPSEYMDVNVPENAPTYLIGTMGSYAPMEFRDEYGQSIGFDIDIIYAIAARQKFNINVLTHPWDGMLNTLSTGERDIIISSVIMTPEREEVYDFSQPYFAMQDVILVKTNNDKIHKFEDLITHKSKISTLNSAAQIPSMISLGVNESDILTKESQFLALKAMFADTTDAAIGDGPIMDYYALSYPEVPTKRMVLPDGPKQYFGIAVKKGNYELRDKLNAGLKQIHEEGIYDRIYFKWFHKPVPKDFLPWANG